MDNFDTIGTNILLGASLSAAVTEKQTREMSARMQEIAKQSSRNSQELAAAIREQNYLLSLNEDERKEYFRQKWELEEKKRQEAEQEAEKRRQREIEAREEEKRYKTEQKEAVKTVALAVVVTTLITVGMFLGTWIFNL